MIAPHSDQRICTFCVMDSSDPEINFDEKGECNHCRDAREGWSKLQRDRADEDHLTAIVAEIKERGKGSDYDCLVGLSGGVDSTYIVYRAKQLGLRCLAMHFDSGWNSELAVKNIEQTVKKLDVDLFTFVCDWNEMKDLQLSFFKAGVPNCDIPQDHAIIASLNRTAARLGIKTILTGNNLASESILPAAWVFNNLDQFHLKSIQREFGNRSLKNYPSQGFLKYYFYYPYVKKIRSVKFLNLIDFNKTRAMETLQSELGWRYYGGKHYESVFTRYFQGSYLPQKFGYDKRRAHLSSLIVSGESTRAEALKELEENPYLESNLAKSDHEFVAKKLGLSAAAFTDLIEQPARSHFDYPNQAWLGKLKNRLKEAFGLGPRVR